MKIPIMKRYEIESYEEEKRIFCLIKKYSKKARTIIDVAGTEMFKEDSIITRAETMKGEM